MMDDAIRNFPTQFSYRPTIEHAAALKKKSRYIVAGMGGSHLGADMLLALKPEVPMVIHSDYGLPRVSKKTLTESLIICSSYSGNTEEVLESYREARKQKLALAVIAVGGALLDLAKRDRVPYIELPNTGIQPRSALGFSLMALLRMTGETALLRELSHLATILKPNVIQTKGKKLAQALRDQVPVIYASERNRALAQNWKIKCNETGKIPAFYNALPELNHNEMTGFDVHRSVKQLSDRCAFVLLQDVTDHPKVQKRMAVLKKLYIRRGLPVHTVPLLGKTRAERLFSSLLLADWTAFHLAEYYGLESEQVPMVEEFKKLIA